MKNNYPIKYALVPMYELINNKREIAYYIISKVYIVSKQTDYKENGTNELYYSVVFPYEINENNEWVRVAPTFSVINGNPTNAFKTKQLFEDPKSAKESKNIANNELYRRNPDFYDNNINLIKYYSQLEKKVFNYTSDLSTIENCKRQSVLRLNNKNECSLVDLSLYNILDIYVNESIYVYYLRPSEFIELSKQDSNININDYLNTLLVRNLKNENMYRVYVNNNESWFIKDNYLIDTNIIDIIEDHEPGAIFFTMENSEDIIKSYEKHPNIKLTLKRESTK